MFKMRRHTQIVLMRMIAIFMFIVTVFVTTIAIYASAPGDAPEPRDTTQADAGDIENTKENGNAGDNTGTGDTGGSGKNTGSGNGEDTGESGEPTQEPIAAKEPTLDTAGAESAPTASPDNNPADSPAANPETSAESNPTQNVDGTPEVIPSEIPGESPDGTPEVIPSKIPGTTPETMPSEMPSATSVAMVSASPSVSPSATPSATSTSEVEAETVSELLVEGKLPAGISNAAMELSGGKIPADYQLYVGSSNADFSSYTKAMEEELLCKVIGNKAFDVHIEDENGNETAIPSGAVATVTVYFGAPAFNGLIDEYTDYIVLHNSSAGIEVVDSSYDADASGLKSITFTTDSFSAFNVVAFSVNMDAYSTLEENSNGTYDITQEIDLTNVTVNGEITANVTSNNQPISGGEYNIGTSFKLDMSYVLDEAKLQLIREALKDSTQEQVTFTYQMPKEIVATLGQNMSGNMETTDGIAGRYEIQSDGKVLFKVNSSFLQEKSNISGAFEYYFRINEGQVGTDNEVSFNFPGSLEPIVVKIKKANVNGWKEYTGYEQKDDKVALAFKITLKNGDRVSDSVAIVDTPQENLDVLYDSIKIIRKKDGKETEITGKTITKGTDNFQIDLGKLEAYDEIIITYKAKIKDPTLDINNDGKIDGIDNKFSWTINGTDGGGDQWAWPGLSIESTGSKSGSVEGQKIKWTVKLNDGSIKSDVSGKTYTDTMTSANQKYIQETLKIIDENWNDVKGQCTVDWSENSFTVTLPADAGNQGYQIEYYTEPAKPLQINDKVEVSNSGDFGGKDIPGETETIERKSEIGLTKTNSGVNLKDLTTKWTAVITPDEDGVTDPVFYDYLGQEREGWFDTTWNGSVFVGDPVVTCDEKTLTSGTEYNVAYKKRNGAEGNNYMTITFKGKYTAPITIEYTSKDNGQNAEGGKTIFNSCHVGNKWYWNNTWYQKTSGDVATGIFKDGTVTYNETDKCYYVDWVIFANSATANWADRGIADLGADTVTIVDTLPDGLEFVELSYFEAWDDTVGEKFCISSSQVDVQTDKQKLIISIKDVKQKQIRIVFKTKLTKLGETIANTVTYSQNEKEIGRATGKVTGGTDLLTKKSEQVEVNGTDLLEYTIKVNEKGINYLPDSDSLILEDTIPANVELVNGSITFSNAEGTSYMYNAATRVLSIQVPDGQAVTVTYQVKPVLDGLQPDGSTGKYKINVKNTVILSGHEDVKSEEDKWHEVFGSGASIVGNKDEIHLYKVDAQATEQYLDGAAYELCEMKTSNGAMSRKAWATTATVGDKKGYICFSGLYFNTVYCYQEKAAPEGYVLDSTEHYFIIKNVEDGTTNYDDAVTAFNEHHKGKTLETLTGGNIITCTNVKRSTAEITAVKSIDGGDIASYEGKFKFKLTEVDDAGNTINSGHTETVSNKIDGTIKFDELVYTEAGEHYYKIEEVPGNLSGIVYDTKAFMVKVTVTKNAFTGFTTTVTYMDADKNTVGKAEFVNKYVAETELKVQKTYDRSFPEGGFIFKLEAVNNAPMPANSDITVTDSAAASFGSIEYTKDGIYNYTIKEVVPNDAVETDEGKKKDGILYDSTVYYVKVVVEKGVITVSYKTKEMSDYSMLSNATFRFTNTYVASGEVVLAASKDLDGRTLANGQFEFELYKSDEKGNTQDKALQTVRNDGNGAIPFSAIKYTIADVGTHYYVISEKIPETKAAGYSYDTSKKLVKVEVTDDADGSLATEVTYPDGSKFQNTYKAEGSASIQLTKKLTGRTLADGQFEFKLYKADAEGKKQGEALQTVRNNGSGTIAFEAIRYKTGDAGTHYYVVEEVNDGKDGYTYAGSKRVTVTVTDDGDGSFATEVTYPDGSEFQNTYKAEGSATILASKELLNRTIKEGEFTFILRDAGGKEIDRETNAANGTVTFDAITYTQGDVTNSPICYTIEEQAGADESIIYDNTKYTVEVTLTDNGNGSIGTQVTYKKGNETVSGAAFTNTYKEEGSVSIQLTKKLTGRTLEDGQFKFKLYKADAEGKKQGEALRTAENTASGTIAFEAISYETKDAGTHYYVVEEVNDGKDGYTYAGSKRVTVTVTDNGTGELEAVATYPDGSEFQNTYKAEGSATISASKTLENKKLKDGEFTFILKDTSGKVIDSKTNDGKGKVTFDTITYTQGDLENGTATFKYILSEKKGNAEGITYDETLYEVEVILADNGKGKIEEDVIYKKDRLEVDAAEFINKYETPTPTPTPDETPSTTPTVIPSTTPSGTPSTTPTATPTGTPSTTPTATPAGTPDTTPEATPDTTPENTPEVSRTPAPTETPTREVLGALRVKGDKGAVLGARRGLKYAVLGKRRRPTTGDSMAMFWWVLTFGMSAGTALSSAMLLYLMKEE